ncbi:MAG: bifunctional nuclease family protein [Acidimicrobiales bacterium]
MSDKPSAAPARAKRTTRQTSPNSDGIVEANDAVSADDSRGSGDTPIATDAFLPLEVVDVVVTLPNPNPLLVLRTTDAPERTLSIPIGVAEGTSIANALRGVATPKPLTHELFAETLTILGASIAVARITAVDGAAFYAELVVSTPSREHTLACRPSDAVAMALRQRPPAPIVTASWVFDALGDGPATGATGAKR